MTAIADATLIVVIHVIALLIWQLIRWEAHHVEARNRSARQMREGAPWR